MLDVVATYPPAGVRKGLLRGPRVRLPLKENERSRHQCLFKENVRKTKMEKVEGLRILKINVRKLFTHGEGISTPRAYHKGRLPSIEFANHDFNIIYFSILYFLLFWGRQRCFPRSYVSSGAMRKSDLRSSLSLKFCWLNCFYLSERLILTEQNSFKALNLETIF